MSSVDLYDTYEELVGLVKKDEPLAKIVGTARKLLSQPRYLQAGSGEELLIADISQLIGKLPDDGSANAAVMLGVNTSQAVGWTYRLDSLNVSGNRSAKKQYTLRLMAFIAYELLRLWQADASHSVADPLERVAYELRLEIDDTDYRKNVLYRNVLVRVKVPSQRIAILPYYYTVGAVEPEEVVTLTEGHRYVGSVPDPQGSESRWWAHVIHLGRPHDAGETLTIATREKYYDKDRRLHDEFPVYGVHLVANAASPAMEFIHLAVRLPRDLRASAEPEARVAEPPMKMPYKRTHPKIDSDGWVHQHFDSDLRAGHEYGLFFPGTQLY